MSSLILVLLVGVASCSLVLLQVSARKTDIYTNRDAIISAAIETVKKEFAAMKRTKYSGSQGKLHAFNAPTPETLAHGMASLKFENMVKLSELNILKSQRQATYKFQTESSLAEVIAMNLWHKTGSVLTRDEIARIYEESDCKNLLQPPSDCDGVYSYSPDGSCNNIEKPLLGAAATPLRRFIPARYDDGVSRARGFLQSQGDTTIFPGSFAPPNPSPRIASTAIHRSQNDNDITHSYLLMQWGQFLDHDITAVPEHESCNDCTVPPSVEGKCFPFLVPEEDDEIQVSLANSKKCQLFMRSFGACPSEDGTVLPREQINSITHFIDGSNIYGHSAEILNMIRDLSSDAGLLKVGPPAKGGSKRPLLPNAPSQSFIVCPPGAEPCFLAGDKRCNEQTALTIMHTLWLREHNRVAQHLKNKNPSLTSDEVFQLARKIVVSELQKITYKDYLPIILGDAVSSQIPSYTGYKNDVDPRIPNSFATAAFRFGHSQIRHTFDRLEKNYVPSPAGPLPLVSAFFNPSLVRQEGTDPILRGQLSVPMMKIDEYIDTFVTNRLFSADAKTPGLDLASLNIQRGRDHGLPKYIIWKQWAERECKLSSDFQHKLTQARMIQVYGDIDNVDLFVGGLAESPLPNSKVGATFACIIAKTFTALRDGDRFFYESTDADTNALSVQQRQEINEKASLARIICDNTDIKEVQLNTFLIKQSRVPCSQVPSVNLDLWSTTTPKPPSELPDTCYVKVRTTEESDYISTSRRNSENSIQTKRVLLSSNSDGCLPINCPKNNGEVLFAVGSDSYLYCTPTTNPNLPKSLRYIPDNLLQIYRSPSMYVQQLGATSFLGGANGLFTSSSKCESSSSVAVTYDDCSEVKSSATDRQFVAAKLSDMINQGSSVTDLEMEDKMQLYKILSENEVRLMGIMGETLQKIKDVFIKTGREGQGDVEEMPSESDLSKLEKLLNRLN